MKGGVDMEDNIVDPIDFSGLDKAFENINKNLSELEQMFDKFDQAY